MNFVAQSVSRFVGLVLLLSAASTIAYASPEDILEPTRPFIAKVSKDLKSIPADRQKELKKAAAFIRSKIAAGEPAQLTFICTHNSRRSHMAQIWTQAAATYYGVEGVTAFSGGTESSAINIRTVRALRRAGLSLTDSTGGTNPVYLIQYSETKPVIKAFSKVYNAEGNPKENYAALMTCSQADKNCPVVEGSTLRISIPYDDPKSADNTPEEAKRYDERSLQIAREMFFLMSQVKA